MPKCKRAIKPAIRSNCHSAAVPRRRSLSVDERTTSLETVPTTKAAERFRPHSGEWSPNKALAPTHRTTRAKAFELPGWRASGPSGRTQEGKAEMRRFKDRTRCNLYAHRPRSRRHHTGNPEFVPMTASRRGLRAILRAAATGGVGRFFGTPREWRVSAEAHTRRSRAHQPCAHSFIVYSWRYCHVARWIAAGNWPSERNDEMSVLRKNRTSPTGASPRWYLLWIVSLSAVLATAAGCAHSSGAVSTPPLQVEVADVEQRDVPLYKEWIGTLDGLVNADIKAEVSGYLIKQAYTEGTFVKKGQLLVSDRSAAISGRAGSGARTPGAVAGPVGAGAGATGSGGSRQ